MKKIMIVGAVVCSGILFASIAMSSSTQDATITNEVASEKGPVCRKFTDICPDGGVGYHCAMSPDPSIPLCTPTPKGDCAQIWPCVYRD